jgi:hypothetical protein
MKKLLYNAIYIVSGYGFINLHCSLCNLRLVPTRAVAGAVAPASGREGGERGARRDGGAVAWAPGGSARYRPAAARAGGDSGARGRRQGGGSVGTSGREAGREGGGNG